MRSVYLFGSVVTGLHTHWMEHEKRFIFVRSSGWQLGYVYKIPDNSRNPTVNNFGSLSSNHEIAWTLANQNDFHSEKQNQSRQA